LIGDHLENAAGGFGQMEYGPVKTKRLYLPPFEFCVLAGPQANLRCGFQGNAGAVYFWPDFVQAGVAGDFVVF